MTVLTELDRMREAVGEDEWLVAGSLNGACKLIANGATVGIAFDLHRSHAAYIAALHNAYPFLRAEIERLRSALHKAQRRLDRNDNEIARILDARDVIVLALSPASQPEEG